MEVYSVTFSVAFPVVEWVAPFRTGGLLGWPVVVPGGTVAVIVDNERWVVVGWNVSLVGKAEILAFEEFSLTELEEDGEEVVFKTSILPGVEVVCHRDCLLIPVVDRDVELVIRHTGDGASRLLEGEAAIVEDGHVVEGAHAVGLPGVSEVHAVLVLIRLGCCWAESVADVVPVDVVEIVVVGSNFSDAGLIIDAVKPNDHIIIAAIDEGQQSVHWGH